MAASLALILGMGCEVRLAPREEPRVSAGAPTLPDAGSDAGPSISPEPRADDPRSMSPLIHVGGEPWLVLDAEPEESWARGVPGSVVDSEAAVASRFVALDRLPAPIRARAAQRWALVGARGQTCVATLDKPRLIRRTEWAQDWAPEPDNALAQDHVSQLWLDARDVLAARAMPLEGSCARALFAHVQGAAPEQLFVEREGAQRVEEDRELRNALMVAFLALPEQQRIQADYLSYVMESGEWADAAQAPPTWIAHQTEDGPTIRLAADARGRRIAVVSVDFEGGCGDYGDSLYAVFEVREPTTQSEGAPGVELRMLETGAVEEEPLLFLDVEGDGVLEGAAREAIRVGEGSERAWTDLRAPQHGCGC